MLTQVTTALQHAANDAACMPHQRERTVPIPNTIRMVIGYPEKLVVFKMAASKFWQVRCWHQGRTHRKTTKTTRLAIALNFARQFYDCILYTSDAADE